MVPSVNVMNSTSDTFCPVAYEEGSKGTYVLYGYEMMLRGKRHSAGFLMSKKIAW
jgi:hypothetical protein